MPQTERRRAQKAAAQNTYRARNPEKARAAVKRWREENRDRYNKLKREYARRAYLKNPEKILAQKREGARRRREANLDGTRAWERERRLVRRYGMTQEQFDQMFAAQGSACAICAITDPGVKHGWNVDHCHDSGAVRAILCHGCNMALGKAKDSPELLRKMAAYIESHRGV